MGTANVNVDNGAIGQGGVQPRQAIVNDATSVETPSQSGSNEGDGLQGPAPEIQPVEE